MPAAATASIAHSCGVFSQDKGDEEGPADRVGMLQVPSAGDAGVSVKLSKMARVYLAEAEAATDRRKANTALNNLLSDLGHLTGDWVCPPPFLC